MNRYSPRRAGLLSICCLVLAAALPSIAATDDSRDDLSRVAEFEKLGSAQAAKGDMEAAEASFVQAAEAWDAARLRGVSGTAPATPYEYLALAHLERGNTAQAWPAVERARARALTDRLISGKNAPFTLERVQASLSARTAIVGWLDFELGDGLPRFWAYAIRAEGPVRWARLDAPDADADSLAERLRGLRDRLGDSTAAIVGRSADATLGDLQALWKERIAPLLPFLDGVEEIALVPSWAMSGFPLEALADDTGRLLADRFVVTYAPSATIHAWLRVNEAEAHSPRSGLFVGDPPFRSSHVAAMEQDRGKLLRGTSPQVELSVMRSALRGDRRAAGRLPRLAWSRDEVDWAAQSFAEATVLVGPKATEAELSRLAADSTLAGFDVVHLASHALIENEEPERSGLALSQVGLAKEPGSGPDGILTGAEVNRDWKLNAELVVLSSCRAAYGPGPNREGTAGLAYPFLQAGARAQLISLWPVNDQVTAFFMDRFYESWLGTEPGGKPRMSKAEALREAKLWLREQLDRNEKPRFADPYYWSAFILVGDGG